MSNKERLDSIERQLLHVCRQFGNVGDTNAPYTAFVVNRISELDVSIGNLTVLELLDIIEETTTSYNKLHAAWQRENTNPRIDPHEIIRPN